MEYAFSYTALRGHIDPTMKASGIRVGGGTREEESQRAETKEKANLSQGSKQYLLDMCH